MKGAVEPAEELADATVRQGTVVTTAALLAVAAAIAMQSHSQLSAWRAVVLGAVEGITEFLPISSTGHLLITGRLLDLGDPTDSTALGTYVIAIQVGAIAAVIGLYRRRIAAMAMGATGRDVDGRRLLRSVVIAFVPAALVGVTLESVIKDRLFAPWPVVIAWIVGGIVLLVWRDRVAGTVRLESITSQQALVIGVAQIAAMWPGMSRSLVTLLAALAVGLSIGAAVEFSFLLGLATLTAATTWDLSRHGSQLVDAYGWATPALGAIVAFVAASLSVTWMTTYLRRHSLRGFGWYRLVAAAVTVALLATGAL